MTVMPSVIEDNNIRISETSCRHGSTAVEREVPSPVRKLDTRAEQRPSHGSFEAWPEPMSPQARDHPDIQLNARQFQEANEDRLCIKFVLPLYVLPTLPNKLVQYKVSKKKKNRYKRPARCNLPPLQ